MFAGHYAAAFAAKGAQRRIPFWVLFVAVQFLDVVWSIFVLLGIEKLRIVPEFTESNALDLYYMPFTHGLWGALGWSLIAYALLRVVRVAPGASKAAVALVVGLAVFSHFVLDIIVHVPDLPLWGNADKIGLGLWNSLAATLILEAALIAGSAWWYARRAADLSRRERRDLAGFTLILVAANLVNYVGPPAPSAQVAALMALIAYVVLAALAYVLDRRGAPRPRRRSEVRVG